MFLGKYCHGSVNKHMGRIGAVCVVSVDCKMDMLKILKLDSILQTMSDKIAQHIVACSPVTIQKDSETSLDRPCLLEQDWFFGTGSVQDMLNVFESEYKVKVKVDRFKRYEVGEDFSEEQTKI